MRVIEGTSNFVSGSIDRYIRVWNSEGVCSMNINCNESSVNSIDSIYNTDIIVSGSVDGVLRIWSYLTG